MKQKMKNIILLIILSCFLLTPITALADDTTKLTTSVPESVFLDLNITGDGTVVISDKEYRNSGKIEIPRNKSVNIVIKPDNLFELESVKLDGKELKNSGVVNRYEISCGLNSLVDVVFKKQVVLPTPTPTPTPTKENVNTGDALNSYIWYILLFSSMSGILSVWFYRKRKV